MSGNPFIVEKTLNTSYIDSLFVALFYEPSHIQNILSEYPTDIRFLYLQELIHENFVSNMRRRYFIDGNTINEIRNYMVLCGWKNDLDITYLYAVQELYSFLINGFLKTKLRINTKSSISEMNYIELKARQNSNLKLMLDDYFNENFPQFYFESLPNFITVYINRNYETKGAEINSFFVDINKAISFPKYNTNSSQKDKYWVIHSIVCYSRADNGHYYSVVTDRTSWYLFSNSKLPSLLKIDIKNEDISARIKQECVLAFYVNPYAAYKSK
jgi:hypothetical protein